MNEDATFDSDKKTLTSHLSLTAKIAWWMLKCAVQTGLHKYYVAVAARKTRCSWWRVLTHDLSKFGPRELYGYARNWHGDKGDDRAWHYAWLHHFNVNDHHWEYWVQAGTGQTVVQLYDMPEAAVREMVADWIAATRTHNKVWVKDVNDWEWFQHAWPLIRLRMTSTTIALVLNVMFDAGLIKDAAHIMKLASFQPVAEPIAEPEHVELAQMPVLADCECGTQWRRDVFSPDACPDCGKPVDEV